MMCFARAVSRIAGPSALAAVVSALGMVAGVSGQSQPTIGGIVAGYASTEHVWQPSAESAAVGGVILGGYLMAATPVPWLSVRAEGVWTRRSADRVDGDDPAATVGIRADYLAIGLHLRASRAFGRGWLHVSAGPALDQLLRSRMDPGLQSVLLDSTPSGVGVSAAVGGGFRIGERFHAELEARVFEGLGDAFSGDFLSVRNRSIEVVSRLGIPIGRR